MPTQTGNGTPATPATLASESSTPKSSRRPWADEDGEETPGVTARVLQACSIPPAGFCWAAGWPRANPRESPFADRVLSLMLPVSNSPCRERAQEVAEPQGAQGKAADGPTIAAGGHQIQGTGTGFREQLGR